MQKFKLLDKVRDTDGRPGTVVRVAYPLLDGTRNYLVLWLGDHQSSSWMYEGELEEREASPLEWKPGDPIPPAPGHGYWEAGDDPESEG